MTGSTGRSVSIRRTLLAAAVGLALAAFPAHAYHSIDKDQNYSISLSELLRAIQFYNSLGYHCESGTEDGWAPGVGDQACTANDLDYNTQDWVITLSELLRVIQFYNSHGYGSDQTTEDGFAPLASNPETQDDSTVGDLKGLAGFIGEQDPGAVDPTTGDQMRNLLDLAQLKMLGNLPCDAADVIQDLLQLAQELRAKGGDAQNAAEYIYAFARLLQNHMVSGAGGCPNHPKVGQEPDPTLPKDDVDGVTVEFEFGEPKFVPSRQGGKNFSALMIPGTEPNGGPPGAPDVPAFVKLIAAPPDAAVDVTHDEVPGEVIKVNLLPNIEQPVDPSGPYVDQAFGNKPFVLDQQIYDTDRPYPPNPVELTFMGRSRGMDIYQLTSFCGQYNPVTDELQLYDRVHLDVTFRGNSQAFEPEFGRGPFESHRDVFTGALLNKNGVRAGGVIQDFGQYVNFGEEFMIMTHPTFRAAADTLAAWKNQKGIVTHVYECGTGSAITGRISNEEIDAFIEDHYENSKIKPRYILFLGDAEFIPTFLVPRAADATKFVGSDHPYAVIPFDVLGITFDLFPTFAIGRIPVDTLDQANTVVQKIINYEKSPPGSPLFDDDFYNRISIAAQFQCCRTDIDGVGYAQRTFVEMPEAIRPALLAAGYEVPRHYRETIDGGCASCDPPSPAYTKDATPRRNFDGTLIPAEIGPGSGFSWTANTADVVNAFNDHSFIVFHRDHGAPTGWGDPPFYTGDIDSLTNGAYLPVVFSVNCSSGVFDNETSGGAEGTTVNGVYFAEKLLRKADGGAVGVIGDSRVSPSWPNSVLAKGFFDAIFPSVLPDFGDNTSKRRLGDILIHGEMYLFTQINVAPGVGGQDTRDEFFLYHVIGDPTLEVWTSDPKKNIFPSNFSVLGSTRTGATIGYGAEGAELTLTKFSPAAGGLIPIGRGIVKDGKADIDFFNLPDPGDELLVSASGDNAVSVDGKITLPLQ